MYSKFENLVDVGIYEMTQFYVAITDLFIFLCVFSFSFTEDNSKNFFLLFLFLSYNLIILYKVSAYSKNRFCPFIPYLYSRKRIKHIEKNFSGANSINPFYKIERLNQMKVSIKYCLKCEYYVPLRFYHCNTCNKCIYRRDFHSPKFKNCINFFTLKTYFNFNLASIVSSIILIVTILFFMTKKGTFLEITIILVLLSVDSLINLYYLLKVYRNIGNGICCVEEAAFECLNTGLNSDMFELELTKENFFYLKGITSEKSKKENLKEIFNNNFLSFHITKTNDLVS